MTKHETLDLFRYDVDFDDLSYREQSLEELIARELPEATILGAVKARLGVMLDLRAEQLRSGVITPGAGQALEYQEAQAQAAAALKAPGGATEAKYPMLAATIGIDIDPDTGKPATDVLGVARGIQAARDAWLTTGAAIRGARLSGKAAIQAAETYEAVEQAYLAVQWPERSAAA